MPSDGDPGGHGGHDEHGGSESGAPGPPRGFGPRGHAMPGGLSLAANGLRFAPAGTRFEAGAPDDWTFRLLDEAGDPVTAVDESHGASAHLIVVRRDLTRFQHRHPTLDPDGTWRVPDLALPTPGTYRAFLDVVVDGRPATLGFDLFAPGETTLAPRPGSTRRDDDGDYRVDLLETDDAVVPGETTTLHFAVTREDEPVSRLDPYLGARGHLVALREGDLAYLHVHPVDADLGSGRVAFDAAVPTPGRYRLFFQARPEGASITTRFDLRVDG